MEIALGLLNLTISRDPIADHHTLAELAGKYEYRITNVLRIDSATFMPIALMVQTATEIKAVAIVAPGIGHFGAGPGALAIRYHLITPTQFTKRTGGWSPYT